MNTPRQEQAADMKSADPKSADPKSAGLPSDQAHPHEEEIPANLPQVSTRHMAIAVTIIAVAFAGLFALGWFPRHHRIAEAEADARQQDDRPVVDVAQPVRKNQGVDLVLPADVRAMQETPIYPRTNGYLKRWLIDVGQHVDAGQLLAEIDTPEVDAQHNQSMAQLEQIKANVTKAQADLNLAKVTLQRYLDAKEKSPGAVTAQDVDEKQAAYNDAASALKQAMASVVAGESEVTRLATLQGFEKITAPFSGVLTTRNYDVGALLQSGNTAIGSELFRIQQTETLRAFVNVPQSYITAIKMGQDAFLTVRNSPGREFKGVVTRSNGALDPATRTLRYEIDIANVEGALFAGMYGQARLVIAQDHPPMLVPTSAIVFDASGTRVGIVEDDKVHFRTVELGRDFGTQVEIATGLDGSEKVVTNPGLRMAEGGAVRLADPAAANAAKPDTARPQISER